MRDRLQKGIYSIIDPVVRGLVKVGITPNFITTTGLVLNIGVAIVFIIGRRRRQPGRSFVCGLGGRH